MGDHSPLNPRLKVNSAMAIDRPRKRDHTTSKKNCVVTVNANELR